MNNLLVDFANVRFSLFLDFYQWLGERRGGMAANKNVIAQNLFSKCCSTFEGQMIPALQTAHTSSLLHHAVLLILVIYWDPHHFACFFPLWFWRIV